LDRRQNFSLNHVPLARANLGMFTMFGRTRVPTKEAPQVRECKTAAQHFLACWGLFMACCDI